MPNDKRKMIKWQPFSALNEYQDAINKLVDSQSNIDKPLISEDSEKEIDYLLKKSLIEKKEIEIYFYQQKQIVKIKGTVIKIELEKVILENHKLIPLKNIVNIVE